MKTFPKYLLIALSLCFAGLLSAQTTWGLETGLRTGYEWNILRSPASFSSDTSTLSRGELWRSAWRNDVIFNPKLDIKKGNHRVKFATDFKARVYQGNADANLYTWITGANYGYKFNKKVRYFGEVNYRLNRRAVQLENDDILQLPDAYDKLTWETGLKLRPGNWHFAKAGIFGQFKRFRSDSEDPTRYMEIGMWVEDRHKIKKEGGEDHQISWEVRWRERFYAASSTNLTELGTIEDPEEIEDSLEGQGFHWRYMQIGGDYELPLGKYWVFTPSARLRLRKDVRNDQGTFRELGIGAGMAWEKGKTSISVKSNYQYRVYPGFQVEVDEEESNLRYQYIKSSVRANYQLTDALEIQASLNSWNRISNNRNPASRGRRSFDNIAIMTGITYTFGN